MPLPSDKVERAFERIGRSFNYRLIYQAMSICSLSEKEVYSMSEVRSFAYAISKEYYSYFTRSQMYVCECEITKKSLYAKDFLTEDFSLEKLKTFFKAIEKTGLIVLDSRDDSDLFYIINSDFADMLYNFAILQNH
jgi:hypothetical protein